MKFEWDEDKRRANIAKHGIDFRAAVKVFTDPRRVNGYDLVHSEEGDRWWVTGKPGANLGVLFVVYTERHGDTIRLISARKASKNEREAYDKG